MSDTFADKIEAHRATNAELEAQLTRARMRPGEHIIQICAIAGDGEHKLVALTSGGRLFERVADRQSYNTGPGNKRQFAWLPLAGPLDQQTGG